MLKNKIIVRKIRNIIILLMIMAVMIGAYKNIDRSRAEEVIEIGAIALDNYGYLEEEEFILEAKEIDEDKYEIELPESINTKKVNKIVKVSLEDFEDTETTEETSVETSESTENSENAEDTKNVENTEKVEENILEIVENKIYLTGEEIDSKEINIEVEYDVAILEEQENGTYNKNLLSEKSEEERAKIEITEETKTLYSKILRYEDEENKKLVELKGYLPVDAELEVRELTQEEMAKAFGDRKMQVAYDIKIIQKVVTTIPADEADPTAKPEEVVEIIEINPEDLGEKCEVTITDTEIKENSKVLHVKEDNSVEEVKVKENTEGNISFEAETFSVYGVEEPAAASETTQDISEEENTIQENQIEAVADSGETNTTEITNDNIGEYIDLGLSLVGTEATTDDWRILYVDTEGEIGNSGNIYVMLDDYLPNSTGYAEAIGLETEGTHQVKFSGTQEDVYDFYKKLQNNWTALAMDIGIVGATVAGVPTDRLIQSSYNYKNNTNIDFTTNPAAIISGDIWVKPWNGDVGAYWFEYGQNNTDTILAMFSPSGSGRCYYKV